LFFHPSINLLEVNFLEERKGKMTVEEAGRRGGLKTSETHGEEFYSEIGRKGGRIGGPKGGQRVRKLIQEGKEHEGE
jgi:general stress protein YciG